MEFSLKNFDVSRLDCCFKEQYSLDIRLSLIELKEFLVQAESYCKIHDRFNVSQLTLTFQVCNDDVLFYLKMENCSDVYRKIMRRKFGLNALETISNLYKYSVTDVAIILFLRGKIF